MTTPEPILETRGLRFGHGRGSRGERILGGPLDLTLHRGELVALLGPNGAGKSTLLRSLCGFLPPIAGTVRMGGKTLTDYSPRELARVRGVLPTRENPPAGMLVEELVALGRHPHSNWSGRLTGADRAAIETALAETGSGRFRSRPVGELSDGERQRVSLARLLAQEPSLAFLDEPAAFLDLPSRIEILGKLAEIARTRNIGFLLTTHDLESALRHADRLWLLGPDGLWNEGAPEDLVLSGALPLTFPSSALQFDTFQGNFHPRTQTGRRIGLSGPDPHRLWTARGLQRKGWEAATGDEASGQIQILSQNGHMQWVIHRPNQPVQTVDSIGSCLRILGGPP